MADVVRWVFLLRVMGSDIMPLRETLAIMRTMDKVEGAMGIGV